MMQPWTIATPWGAVRLEIAAAAAVLFPLAAFLVWWWRRSRRRRAAARAGAQSIRRATPEAPRLSSLERVQRGLDKTRAGLVVQLAPVLGQRHVDQTGLDDIEAALLGADVG